MVNRYTRHEIAPNQMPGMEATTAFVTAADYDKLLADYSAMVAESAAAVRRQVTDWKSAADAKEEEDNNYRLIQRQGDLLCGVVNALKGEPPEDTLWSHHDAPELAQALRAENDQRKADDAIEFRAMEALVSENDMLRKRIDSLTTELAHTLADEENYPLDRALHIARLWRAGKLIGGNENAVIFALLKEIERYQSRLP